MVVICPEHGIRLYGSATVWDDVTINAGSTNLGGTKQPTFTKLADDGNGSQGVFTYAFSASQEQEVYFQLQLPHGWMVGSEITPSVHWLPATAGTDGQRVQWGLEYTWLAVGEIVGNTTTITTTDIIPPVPNYGAKQHYISEFPASDPIGRGVNAVLLCRLYRDATATADDYTGVAYLANVDIHVQIDKMGTREVYYD